MTKRFWVGVKRPDGTEGLEAIGVNAPDADTAKTIYAALGGSTVADLEAAGLTAWSVEEIA